MASAGSAQGGPLFERARPGQRRPLSGDAEQQGNSQPTRRRNSDGLARVDAEALASPTATGIHYNAQQDEPRTPDHRLAEACSSPSANGEERPGGEAPRSVTSLRARG